MRHQPDETGLWACLRGAVLTADVGGQGPLWTTLLPEKQSWAVEES